MIKPEKYLDPDVSVLSVSAMIIELFKSGNLLTYSEVFQKVIKKKGDQAKVIFLPALDLLFLLGKIEYHKEIDTLEFKK